MARMVLGLATSHSPQLSLPPEHWLMRGEEDRLNPSLYRVPDGKHVTFDELLAEVDPKVAQELTPEVFQQRHEANQKGIARLAEALEHVAPDVLVILGDDQHSYHLPGFRYKNVPADNADTQTALPFYSDHVSNNLDLLLLVRELYEQALIYARYGAKAEGEL